MQSYNTKKEDTLIAWLTLHFCPGLYFAGWQKHFGNNPPEEILRNPNKIKKSQLPENIKKMLLFPDKNKIHKALNWQAENSLQQLISFADAAYPPYFREISQPPFICYVYGNMQLLQKPQIAIVGSRNASLNGRRTATQFAATLSQLGIVITSGLALGIDSAGHQGALSVAGETIAVLGTGIDIIYPRQNRKLAEAIIANNGCLLTEYPLQTPPRAQHFPKRNRLISALSEAVLVIEAGLQSGSLSTAYQALSQNKDILVVPGSIQHPNYSGSHALLKQGAALIESVQDILEASNFLQKSIKTDHTNNLAKNKTMTLTKELQYLLQCIDFNITTIDAIIQESGVPLERLGALLLQLEISGTIKKVMGGYVRLSE